MKRITLNLQFPLHLHVSFFNSKMEVCHIESYEYTDHENLMQIISNIIRDLY